MLELIFHNRAYIQYALVGVALIMAWRIGAAPERLCALSVTAITLVDVAYHSAFSGDAADGWNFAFHTGLDLAGLIAILSIALQANREYPLWLTALQGASFLIHVAHQVDPQTQLAAYVFLNVFPYYLMLLVLIGGTINHRIREHRHGLYRSWRMSSPPS